MAYRQTTFRIPCARCDGDASGQCLRCDIPLCADHEPPDSARCNECEREFFGLQTQAKVLPSQHARIAFCVQLLVPVAAALFVTIAWGLVASLASVALIIAGGLLVATLLAITGLLGLLENPETTLPLTRARRAFLAERPGATS